MSHKLWVIINDVMEEAGCKPKLILTMSVTMSKMMPKMKTRLKTLNSTIIWTLKTKNQIKRNLFIWFINNESHFMNWNIFINHQLSRSSIILSSRSPTWPFFSLFHFIRRFWNQIFTCLSVSDVVFANCIRRSAFKYGWRQNSASNSISWRDE